MLDYNFILSWNVILTVAVVALFFIAYSMGNRIIELQKTITKELDPETSTFYTEDRFNSKIVIAFEEIFRYKEYAPEAVFWFENSFVDHCRHIINYQIEAHFTENVRPTLKEFSDENINSEKFIDDIIKRIRDKQLTK